MPELFMTDRAIEKMIYRVSIDYSIAGDDLGAVEEKLNAIVEVNPSTQNEPTHVEPIDEIKNNISSRSIVLPEHNDLVLEKDLLSKDLHFDVYIELHLVFDRQQQDL